MKDINTCKLDCEERFGLNSAGAVAAGKFSSLVLGCVLTAVFYAVLSLCKLVWSDSVLLQMFFPGGEENRTLIPVVTVLCSMWTLAMLLIKKSKLKLQTLLFRAYQQQPQKNCTLQELYALYPEPGASMTAVMLEKRLRLQKTMLSTADQLQIMENSFDDMEKELENNFMFISGLIWSIPVLGFIGTVLGLARAVSNFGALAGGDKLSFEAVLPQVTGGLATAFETTLIALVMALILQLFSTLQQQSELALANRIKAAVSELGMAETVTSEVAEQ